MCQSKAVISTDVIPLSQIAALKFDDLKKGMPVQFLIRNRNKKLNWNLARSIL